MPNFIEEFGEDDDQFQSSAIFAHSSMASPTETGGDINTPSLSSSSSRKKRSLPGNPDPDAQVVALSPKTLMATNRYICEVCHKGFQRDQNLQLHRRGHNLPWKLKQRPTTQAKKRVFVCPDPTCVHHNPARALGDLTGIKKHYCRKHGEKKWKCDKCSKRYAVQSDWKAHAKICGTREYRCGCATIFSRKDSFVTHRAFCDALSEENYRANQDVVASAAPMLQNHPAQELFSSSVNLSQADAANKPLSLSSHEMIMARNFDPFHSARTLSANSKAAAIGGPSSPPLALGSAYTSATALLQKAAEMGSKTSDNTSLSPILLRGFTGYFAASGSKGSSAARFNAPAPQISTASNGMDATVMGSGDIAEMGLYDLSVLMNSSGGSSSGLVLREEEKMTVDFLGVAPPSFSSRSKYGDDASELGSMRQSLQDMHSQW